MASPGNQHCANCIGTPSSPLDAADDGQPVLESVLDRFIRFCRTHYGVHSTDRHAYHGTSMTVPCRVM